MTRHTNPLRPGRRAIATRLRAEGAMAARAGKARDDHPHKGDQAALWQAGWDSVGRVS